GVHLLLDDVRGLADLAAEERGVLDDRGPDLGVALELGVAAERPLEALPASHLVGKDIVHPPDGTKFHSRAAYGRCERAGQAPRPDVTPCPRPASLATPPDPTHLFISGLDGRPCPGLASRRWRSRRCRGRRRSIWARRASGWP